MRCLVCGSGGFIGGHLVTYLMNAWPNAHIVAVDKKPIPEWYQVHNYPTNLCLDLTDPVACAQACEGVDEVYQLAADMGGMGFIERYRIECMRSIFINTNMLEAAYRAGVKRYFYSSSACIYPAGKQDIENPPPLKESDAIPAESERGYGWEKLYSEMACQEYWAERGLETHIARFFNVAGPYGTWCGGREKAPAAICRKVIEAKDTGVHEIEIWGDGEQTRDFTWVGDCCVGIDKIMHCDKLIATPCNLGSDEVVTINQLVSMAEEIGGITLERKYNLKAPQGVRGRNSDNTFIKATLGWEPTTPLWDTMEEVYKFVESQYMARKAGKRVVA